jgi:hypothetical protein
MLKRIGAEEGGEFKAVASGTLPSGKPVIINADGTVSVVAQTSISETIGSETKFESAPSDYVVSTFDTTNNKVIVAYRDVGNSNRGTAVVGTVSGTSISFGSPNVFRGNNCQYIGIAFNANEGKCVISYRNATDQKGEAIVGTVSGTSISFGTAAIFNNADTEYTVAAYDAASQNVVIAYKDQANSSYGTAVVAVISGTSISFGSEVVFQSTNSQPRSIVYDSGSSKVIIGYKKYDSWMRGFGVVGTVSGNGISFGTPVRFDTHNTSGYDIEYISLTYDSNENKTLFAYRGDSQNGQINVGTVSGTSISFGTVVTFHAANTQEIMSFYDPDAQLHGIAYEDVSNTDFDYVTATISGTSATISSPSTITTAGLGTFTHTMGATYDTNANKGVLTYTNESPDTHGVARVIQNAYTSTTLTSENYIGMSRGFAVQTGSASNTGSETVFESAATDVTLGAYDTTNDKVLIAYKDQGNSNYGTAIVGTISGTSISFGTAVVFESAAVSQMSMSFDSTAGKFLIAYKDEGNNNYGTAIVATISGTSVSFGSPTVFANNGNTNYSSTVYDPVNDKTIIAYSDGGNSSHGTAIVGTISGTSVSFGSAVVFEAATSTWMSAVHDSSAGKIVIIYSDEGNSNRPTGIVGTVSGTSISFGSAATVSTDNSSQTRAVFDSTNNKVVLCYKNASGTPEGVGTAAVGTVSGTSISFGSTVDYSGSDAVIAEGRNAISFDSSSSGVLIVYEGGDNRDAKAVRGVVSGTSITFGTVAVLDTGGAHPHIGNIYDPDQNTNVVFYKDAGNSNYGTALVFQPDTRATTRGEVADGGNASMDIIGSVSDNQIGLTAGQQYYVQTDGTISTTAGSPSVLAGTAISATELLVKT